MYPAIRHEIVCGETPSTMNAIAAAFLGQEISTRAPKHQLIRRIEVDSEKDMPTWDDLSRIAKSCGAAGRYSPAMIILPDKCSSLYHGTLNIWRIPDLWRKDYARRAIPDVPVARPKIQFNLCDARWDRIPDLHTWWCSRLQMEASPRIVETAQGADIELTVHAYARAPWSVLLALRQAVFPPGIAVYLFIGLKLGREFIMRTVPCSAWRDVD